MKKSFNNCLTIRTHALHSKHLNRRVAIDCMFSSHTAGLQPDASGRQKAALLLINDGQLLEEAGFSELLSTFLHTQDLRTTVFAVGIYAGKERLMEYGTSVSSDYLGRGARAASYAQFVIEELLPWVMKQYTQYNFTDNYTAGFSLGGLSALDIVMNYPAQFKGVGVFSGSLWWRSLAVEDPHYNDTIHRLAHAQLTTAADAPWLKYFFECGTEDEEADRNNSGIIDSIKDTLDFITALHQKGVSASNYQYVEIEGGKHDMKTWAIAWPCFFNYMLR